MDETTASATVIRTANAEHYRWGGPHGDTSDGWYLLKSAEMHVIEEQMPPGASETPHHHVHARQFFYVLAGEMTMEFGDRLLFIRQGEGIGVAPGVRHRVVNGGDAALRFLLVSQPPSHGDRIEMP